MGEWLYTIPSTPTHQKIKVYDRNFMAIVQICAYISVVDRTLTPPTAQGKTSFYCFYVVLRDNFPPFIIKFYP